MGDQKNLHADVRQLKAMVEKQNQRIEELLTQLKEGCKNEEEEYVSSLKNINRYLQCVNPDFLYHLNLNTGKTDFPKTFGDVRFVCVSGTETRVKNLAYHIIEKIGLKLNDCIELKNISAAGHRYAMYKVGPVLCASHGIGGPSISIILNELIKLVHYAECKDPVFFRLGTSGGINIDPGTLVVTSEALDGRLRPIYEVVIQTEPVQRSSALNEGLANELVSLSNPSKDGYNTILGKTLTTDDFYEGQSRLDGAFCDYTPEKKREFLEKLSENNIANIEMEAVTFAGLTNHANIRSAVVCVAIVNRMNGDQIDTPSEILKTFETRPRDLIVRYIQKELFGAKPEDEEEPCECPR